MSRLRLLLLLIALNTLPCLALDGSVLTAFHSYTVPEKLNHYSVENDEIVLWKDQNSRLMTSTLLKQ
jgi:hypothetical protein